MASRSDIMKTLEQWLAPADFKDYCPNGLQVEGTEDVKTIVTGVTASKALIDAAVDVGADMILVHHGYFWKGEDPAIRGMKRDRIKALLNHDVNLVGYHLPLDDHPEFGNNRQLANVLGIRNPAPLGGLVWQGELPSAMSPAEFKKLIAQKLDREPLWVGPSEGEGAKTVSRVGWCTGAAQGFIGTALDAGLDAYISGEISEPTTHTARECGIHYYAAGHHATERYGVQAIGRELEKVFGVTHRFIDCDNPV